MINSMGTAVWQKFLTVDWFLCDKFMKITGLGRRGFFISLVTPLLLAWVLLSVVSIIQMSAYVVFGLVALILYGYDTYKYLKWLKEPGLGHSTIKVNNIYINISEVRGFIFMTMFLTLWTLLVAFLNGSIISLLSYFIFGSYLLLFFAACTWSGPPKPDNTYWQRAKGRVKNIIQNHNHKPSIVPVGS